jgi:glucose/arabinose dehydrogenase
VTGNEMPARGGNPNLTDDEILTVIAYLRELNAGTATLVLDQQGEAPAVTTWNGFNYRWVKVVDNLDIPLLATHAGDGSGRIFVVEQMGRIMIVADGALNPEPFLDINNLLPVGVQHGIYTEQGLLGLAFHPNYAENGLFFVSYSNHAGDSVIARYRVSLDDPNRADPDSQVILLTVDQPFEDHNGGNIVFGPDGYLYIGFGDGGRPADPNYNSQRPDVYLGKMLRIDVNAETYTVPADNPFVDDPEFLPEIWAWGLRNPWRFTFDRETGDLFIGDVGQWLIEELDFQPGTSTGGENYGWSAFEGNQPYLEDETVRSEHTPPIHQYFHDVGSSITGGYVYRGQALPGLWGEYIYGDYVSGVIWIGHFDETGAWVNETFMDSGFVISSFGEDEQGELLLVDYKGAVYRLEASEPIEAEPETETEPGAEAGEATGTGAAGD